MFLLRIFITGLVALIPSSDGRNLTLIIQSATQANDPTHVPVLIFPCEDASKCAYDAIDIAKSLKLDDNIQNGLLTREAETFGGIRLKGTEILISDLPHGDLAFIGKKRARHFFDLFGAIPGNRSEAMDFSWLPSMVDIVPRAGTVDSRFIWNPASSEVAGIFRLHGVEGAVKSFSFGKTEEDVASGAETFVRSLSFRGLHTWIGSPRQALADTAVVEIPVSGPSITISVRPFGGASSTVVEVGPKLGRADILIANLTPRDDLGDKKHSGDHVMGSHFNLYYRLSQNAGSLGEEEKSRLPFLGMKARKVLAKEVEEPQPKIIKVVSLLSHESGGLHRTICTLVAFDEP